MILEIWPHTYFYYRYLEYNWNTSTLAWGIFFPTQTVSFCRPSAAVISRLIFSHRHCCCVDCCRPACMFALCICLLQKRYHDLSRAPLLISDKTLTVYILWQLFYFVAVTCNITHHTEPICMTVRQNQFWVSSKKTKRI